MPSNAPYYSVIIPCYNASATLPDAVQSVLSQTIADFEILLVVDGCPNGTLEVAENLAKADPRIHVIPKENGGVSSARNVGINVARGEVIAFLDSDDIWFPEKLEHHHALFTSDASVMVSYAQIRFMTPEGEPTSVASNRPIEGLDEKLLLAENVTCTTSNLLARSEVFGRVGYFNEALHFDEDKEWIFRAYVHNEPFLGLNEVLTGYRTSPSGLASDLEKMESEWGRFVEIVREYHPDGVMQAFPEARALFLRNLSRRALRLGAPGGEALRLFARAVFCKPVAIFTESRRWIMTGAAACLVAVLPSGAASVVMKKLESVPSKRSQFQGMKA